MRRQPWPDLTTISATPPEVTKELVRWLQTQYPPRCYSGDAGETLEQHLQYAGKVDLVFELATIHEDQRTDASFAENVKSALADLDGSDHGELEHVVTAASNLMQG